MGWECSHQDDFFRTMYSKGKQAKMFVAEQYQTDWLADRTIEWMHNQPKGRLGIHVVSIEPPNNPYVAPEPYMEMFRNAE